MALQGITQNMSSSYHPQSDGQSEVLNRCLEGYLRCMCHEAPKEWAKWLPLAEYWYNTNYQSAIRCTPIEVVYDQAPPLDLPYLLGESKVDSVDRSLTAREEAITILKHNLHKAQNRMKQTADKHRSERKFEVSDWVYLKLQPYRQTSVVSRANMKIAAKYFDPYKVCAKIGSVAYTLQLPAESIIHPTFHVSLLKKHYGPPPTGAAPLTVSGSVAERFPEQVIDKRTVKKHNKPVIEWLVKWRRVPAEDATWEDALTMDRVYPEFHPWGQGSS